MTSMGILIALACVTSAHGGIRDTSASVFDSISAAWHPEALGEQLPVEEEGADEDLLNGATDAAYSTTLDYRARLSGRMSLPRGFRDGKFAGSPLALLQRLRLSVGEKYAGTLLLRKDAGERRIDDLLSWNFVLKDEGPIETFIAGDFVVEGGLGLLLWRPYGLRKGSDVIAPVQREGKGLVPLATSDQLRSFRGIGTAIQVMGMRSTIFYSKKSLAATVTETGDNIVTGFHASGLFRTTGEITKRRAVDASVFGGRIEWKDQNAHACGLTWMRSSFSKRIAVGPWAGAPQSHSMHGGIDADMKIGRVRILAEYATLSSGGSTWISSVIFSPWERMDGVVSFRRIGKGFYALQGSPFGESSTGVSEQGIYFACTFRPASHFRMSWYADSYLFPEGRNGSRFPTRGFEQLLQAEFTGIRSLRIQFRATRARAGVNESTRDGTTGSTIRSFIGEKRRYRCQLEYRMNSMIHMRGRFEYSSLIKYPGGASEDGLLLLQQMQITFRQFDISFRVVSFRSDSYESGIGFVDLDLPGAMSMPVAYGQGVRWTLVVKAMLLREASIALKYSSLVLDDVRRIGSGTEELPSNSDTRVGVQFDFKY